MKTDELIEHLVAEAKPVRVLPQPGRRALLWTAAALAVTAAGILHYGMRRDVAEMWRDPMLLTRLALLGATLWLAVRTAFRLAVPGAEPRAWARWRPLIVLGVLVSLSAAEVLTGAVSGTMGAPMAHWMCVRKVAFVGALPAILAVVLIHRAAPLEPRWTALLGVLAAGAAGALTSEMACPIHAPIHVFLWHIAPVALFGLAGALAGAVIWRRR